MSISFAFQVLVVCALIHPVLSNSEIPGSSSSSHVKVELSEIWCEMEDIALTCKEVSDSNLCVGILFKKSAWRKFDNNWLIHQDTKQLGSKLLEIRCKKTKPSDTAKDSVPASVTPLDNSDKAETFHSLSSSPTPVKEESVENEFVGSTPTSFTVQSNDPESSLVASAKVIEVGEDEVPATTLTSTSSDFNGSENGTTATATISTEEIMREDEILESTTFTPTFIDTNGSEMEKTITATGSTEETMIKDEILESTTFTSTFIDTNVSEMYTTLMPTDSTEDVKTEVELQESSTFTPTSGDTNGSEMGTSPMPASSTENDTTLTVFNGRMMPTYYANLYGAIATSIIVLLLMCIVMIVIATRSKETQADIPLSSKKNTTVNSVADNDVNTTV